MGFPVALLAVRVVLGAVFATAGLTKLLDRKGSRRVLADFGVPKKLAAAASVVLPLMELVTAGALIPAPSARWGGLAALFLLFAFSAVAAANLAQGKRPDCHCFGQAHSTPIGASTLVRNGVLGAMSAAVIWRGPGSSVADAAAWLADVSPVAIAVVGGTLFLSCVFFVQGWLILNLTRQQGRILLRLDSLEALLEHPQGLPVGAAAPEFSLSAVNGEMLTLARLASAGRPVMLIFTSSDCGPCDALLPEIGRWQHDHQKALTIALVARGDPAANRAGAQKHRLEAVLIEKDRKIAEAYCALPTPSAVAIRADSRIMSPVAVGSEAIQGLLARITDAQGGHIPPPANLNEGKVPGGKNEAVTSSKRMMSERTV